MQTNTIVYKNASIFYRIEGSGPLVVLVHGFGESGSVWHNQVEFLKLNFRLLIPDLPGSGKSQYIEGADIETYAEIIKLILDTEIELNSNQNLLSTQNLNSSTSKEKNKATIIGHSMGGYIALAFAQKYPEYLLSFGLFHSSAFADTPEKKEARQKSIAFIKSNGTYLFLKQSIPTLFSKEYAAKEPQQISRLIEDGKSFTEAALIQYYEAMIKRPDRTEVLKNFTGSILFILGEYDIAIPLQAGLQQTHLPVKSYVNILDKSGHMGLWEQTDLANEILHNFLSNNF